MNKRHTNLGKKLFDNTAFALLDVLLTKIGTTIAFVLLVRLLSKSDIAVVGIASGYLVFVAYLDVGPIRVLLRDYPKIAKNHGQRNQLLTALFLFWCLQALSMILVYLGLRSFVFDKIGLPGLSFLFFGMVIDFMALSLQEWLKTVYYSDLQQRVATKVALVLSLLRLAVYVLLFLSPSLLTYTWLLICTAVANSIVWIFSFCQRFRFSPAFNRNLLSTLKQTLISYGLWDHFNRMSISTLFLIDTAVLSWFGKLHNIANYTIALKFCSLFFLVPIQLHRTLQLALSNQNRQTELTDTINLFLKLNFLVSLAQLLFIFTCGEWLIYLLFGVNTSADVVQYVFIISIGVAIMNLGWPFISIINNFCRLHQAFLYLFLPATVFGCAVYIGTAITWGAIGMAYGNIVVYTLLTAGLTAFVAKHYPFKFNFHLIFAQEKKLFQKIIR